MDELVDVLDDQGRKNGTKVEKMKAHKEGICHGASSVAIINSDGKVLLQKRAITKKDAPGKWDLSSSGHISAGEDEKEAAIRETSEEIGINLKENELQLIDTFLFKKDELEVKIKHFNYLYIVRKDITIDMLILQKSEVDEVRYFDREEYKKMLDNNEMVGAMRYCGKILDYMDKKRDDFER